jgi:hypothetical protein
LLPFVAEMKRENGTTTVTEADGTSSQVAIYSNGNAGMVVYPFENGWRWRTTSRAQ